VKGKKMLPWRVPSRSISIRKKGVPAGWQGTGETSKRTTARSKGTCTPNSSSKKRRNSTGDRWRLKKMKKMVPNRPPSRGGGRGENRKKGGLPWRYLENKKKQKEVRKERK